MDCSGLTDVGKVRSANEDAFLIADLRKSMDIHQTSLGHDDRTRLFGQSEGKLLVVADGLGGHAAGGRASTVAIDRLTTYLLSSMRWLFRLEADLEDDFLSDLEAALKHCQDHIQAESEFRPERHGMGTTLTMAYVLWPRLFVVHVGDSRCYLLRESRLEQITTDHTFAQAFADQGVDAKLASQRRWSHTLWNVLGGGSDELKPEVCKAELSVGDTLLLCTDGLTKGVSDGMITALLEEDGQASDLCRRLIDAANEAGGKDNTTVIVARFRQVEQPEDTAAAEASLRAVGRRADAGSPTASSAEMTMVGAPEREGEPNKERGRT
jgi:protein phosphatase